jgi:recombination associated protein RdgC
LFCYQQALNNRIDIKWETKSFTVTTKLITLGFSQHPITGDVVSEFDGGYCLSVLSWEKKIDKVALKNQLSDQVRSVEHMEGRKLPKKEKEQMSYMIIAELIPHILPTPKYTFAYYHIASKTLIVDTVSNSTSDTVTSLLRKAIGSLKATTLYIDTRIGLTESLKSSLGDHSEFINSSILLGNTLELYSEDSKIKFTDLDLKDESTSNEIIEQISSGGMHIKMVSLTYNGISFDLTNEFKLKKMKYDFNHEEDDDKHYIWHTETLVSVCKIVDITSQLVERFQVGES